MGGGGWPPCDPLSYASVSCLALLVIMFPNLSDVSWCHIPWPWSADKKNTSACSKPRQARSQGGGGGGGAVGAVAPPKKMQKKRERERKKENKVACMHVKLPPFNHFQSKIKYKFVLYEEITRHMHQIAPLPTSKCKKLSLWEGGHLPPTPPPPPPRSLRSLGLGRFAPSHVIFTAPLKLNPGYATEPRPCHACM